MASGVVHLAITKHICEHYVCKDRKRLDFGVCLPDFAKDRQEAHIRAVVWGRNKRTYDLNRFRAEFGSRLLQDDLYLGYYLHLVQDVCHRQIVYDRYHWNPLIPGNVDRLHNDYAILNRYTRERYNVVNDLAVPDSYVKIAHSKNIGNIFRCIAEAEGGVIENCSAGKDRTGVISALLLWLCGVRRSDIVYDYMRTKENNRERFKLIRNYNPDIDMNIVIPQESFITDFMDLIIAGHGTIEEYFEAVGIGPELRRKLKEKLCG